MFVKKLAVPALALCLLLSGCKIKGVPEVTLKPEQYAAGISSLKRDRRNQPIEYVIALDQSLSREDYVTERNTAAKALIRSLPRDSCATVLFSSEACEAPFDMLPMTDIERKRLIDEVTNHEEADDGADLGQMMEKALSLFSDGGKGTSKRHVVFIVTGAKKGGTGTQATQWENQFIELCRENKDRVDTYIVHIGEEISKSLQEGLQTEPIAPGGQSAEDLDVFRSSLTAWGEQEAAKVISLPNEEGLETTMLNLRFADADADAIYNRSVDRNTIVSFPVYSLCAQKLTIALTGHASVQDTVQSVKVNGGKNLLKDAVVDEELSTLTFYSEEGMREGLYTVEVETGKPVTLVIACQYDYQVQYGFVDVDYPLAPPEDVEVTLAMRLVKADGSAIDSSDSVELSANLYLDGQQLYEGSIRSGETIQLPWVGEDSCLTLSPVVTYGGVAETLFQNWTLEPTNYPPVLSKPLLPFLIFPSDTDKLHLGSTEKLVTEWETPLEYLTFAVDTADADTDSSIQFELVNEEGELYLIPKQELDMPVGIYSLAVSVQDDAGQSGTSQWTAVIVHVIPLMIFVGKLIIFLLVLKIIFKFVPKLYRFVRETQREKRAEKSRRNLDAAKKQRTYDQEIGPNGETVRAGIRWRIKTEERTYIGGLGLIKDDGTPHVSCSLDDVPSYILENNELKPEKIPLPFAIWKYSRQRNCMELILQMTNTMIVKEVPKYSRYIEHPTDGSKRLCAFDVSETVSLHEISIVDTESGLEALFQLEYYKDHNPLYL